jgi:hypothetical protein
LDDALLRLVLVGTTALPAFALGFWAGARARNHSRNTSTRSVPEVPPYELAAELPLAAPEDAATASLAAPMLSGRPSTLGEIRPLRPAVEQRGHSNNPVD